MIALLTRVALILSVRLSLLAAGAGALWLHYLAMQQPNMMALSVAGVYDALIVLPVVFLYLRKG